MAALWGWPMKALRAGGRLFRPVLLRELFTGAAGSLFRGYLYLALSSTVHFRVNREIFQTEFEATLALFSTFESALYYVKADALRDEEG